MSECELSHEAQVRWPSFGFGVMMIAQAKQQQSILTITNCKLKTIVTQKNTTEIWNANSSTEKSVEMPKNWVQQKNHWALSTQLLTDEGGKGMQRSVATHVYYMLVWQ